MRPHHFVLVCLGVVGLPTLLTFFSLLTSHPRGDIATESISDPPKGGIRAFFSFHTPSTLFPPSAIISLTDDNSTFFLARPADFGPSLTPKGLSAQLWIGSGFGDANIGRGGADSGVEGELGCSDVPGWEDGTQGYRRDKGADHDAATKALKFNPQTSQGSPNNILSEEEEEPSKGDGTDDYLHHPLPSSPVSRSAEPGRSTQHPPSEHGQLATHADIQSLQESAEISGKIVLLSRGGCGFLEKVKWAQRRGATALIVGDHTRGGAIITMYARGDTSNVSIPSIFTSHTTAHLLSSLIPLDSFLDEDDETDGLEKASNRERSKAVGSDDKPTFTSAAAPKSTSISSGTLGRRMGRSEPAGLDVDKQKPGWLRSIFGMHNKHQPAGEPEDSRRPPSSGRLDWFSENWTDESLKERLANSNRRESFHKKGKTGATSNELFKTGSHSVSGDDFVIGVQDWRDPDLVASNPTSKTKSTTTTIANPSTPIASNSLYNNGRLVDQKMETALRGGSITPGSGQYQKPGNRIESKNPPQRIPAEESRKQVDTNTKTNAAVQKAEKDRFDQGLEEEHEGLWVTLTPTTMSTSPFFDTLLVLVVSPLITLTVVYALLLLRSRIRRRRWRAPKSVVDRLPIRTYHTMSCASTTSSSRIATPQASSPSSPLLISSPRSVTARPRPRSATASGIGDAVSASLDKATNASIVQQEKRAHAKKMKKYSGKQVECVVCLEEYVDGESRVMSLPCGHEFHAECITPWLTTRRRTCPVCKGDVVRSMAHPSSNSTPDASTQEQYQDNPNDIDIQVQAAETANESPTAAIPIPCDTDLERGDDMAATLVNDQPEASTPRSRWRGLAASMSLSAFSGEAAWRRAQEDRNR